MTAVGVLGPLLLRGPDGPVRLGSVRQRRLLAALVAHLGAETPSDALVELVWDTAPVDPSAALQSHMTRLRRLLPGGIRIETTPRGYQLLTARADVDVTAFTDHLAAAAAAADPQPRLRTLNIALALWRGRPYAELDHPSLQPEIARLTELRAAAAQQRASVLLEAGRAAEAVAELEALTVAEPLREAAVALLMRALVAAGRQGDALAAFALLRARLADELGLDPAPELRALEQQVLRQQLPAQRVSAGSAGAPTDSPPSGTRAPRLPVSSFVGRDTEVAQAAERMADSRVLTLCGSGGVGKTRLALHVAATVAERYDDGVLLVEFGDGGPADVQPALAAALRLSDAGTGAADSLVARIVEVLAVRRQLLLLDNCEHVADELAGLIEAITSGASGVDLLLTSREPLRVDGEHVLGVGPLDPAAAAALLTDRMRAAGASTLDTDQAELVAELSRRLDGLPLALELAAARAVNLGLRGLLAALGQPLDVLRGGRRTGSVRHRSLRDVIEWSYGMLDDQQRALFERLAVFAGPVEYDAVVGVCGDATALPDLVQRSLVLRHPGEPDRFGMLETLRAFGRSKLAADPAATRMRARHAAWAVRLADRIAADRRGPGEAAAVRRFDTHLPDLRRAHAWLCDAGPLEDLLRLSVLLGELIYPRGRVDLVRLVEDALTVAGALGPGDGRGAAAHPLVARLLGMLATAGWQRGDLTAAEQLARRAIALADAAGRPAAARDAYEAVANVLGFRGELSGALRYAHRAVELAEAAGDVEVQLLAGVDLVLMSAYAGEHAASARHEDGLAAVQVKLDSPTSRAWLAYARGERRAERGDPDAARHLHEAITAAEQVDSGFVAGVARHTLLTSAARQDTDPAAALAAFGPLIDHWHRFGAWTQLWIAIRALTETLSRTGRHHDATVLLGALRASARTSHVYGADAARLHTVEHAARAALGPEFESLRDEGTALGDAAAVALARRLTRPDDVGPSERNVPTGAEGRITAARR